jgi:hypothetical protein
LAESLTQTGEADAKGCGGGALVALVLGEGVLELLGAEVDRAWQLVGAHPAMKRIQCHSKTLRSLLGLVSARGKGSGDDLFGERPQASDGECGDEAFGSNPERLSASLRIPIMFIENAMQGCVVEG